MLKPSVGMRPPPSIEPVALIGAITPSTSPEAYKVLQQQASAVVSVPESLFSPELARLQAVNTSRLQATWSQHYQDVIDSFEGLTVPDPHGVFSPEAARIQQAAPQMLDENGPR